MKKVLLFFVLTLGLSVSVNAQKKLTPVIEKGDVVLNGSTAFGIGGLFYSISGDYVMLDKLIGEVDAITVGAFTNYNSIFGFGLGMQSDYHYQFLNNLDTYAGLQLGYIFGSSTKFGNENVKLSLETKGQFTYGVHLGGRYFFTPKFAAFSELGFGGTGFLKLGISYKF